MCIIAIKSFDQPFPSEETLQNCWDNNPDGAGFFHLRHNAKVGVISKGYMTFESFMDAVKRQNVNKKDLLIYHFRIGTSGGNTPEKTHPFPISSNEDDLNALYMRTTTAFIHNGVFGPGAPNLSDTQLYIRDQLTDYVNHIADNNVLKKVLQNTTGSCRTITIDTSRELFVTTGTWHEFEGNAYSNLNYKAKPAYNYGRYGSYYNPVTKTTTYYGAPAGTKKYANATGTVKVGGTTHTKATTAVKAQTTKLDPIAETEAIMKYEDSLLGWSECDGYES